MDITNIMDHNANHLATGGRTQYNKYLYLHLSISK